MGGSRERSKDHFQHRLGLQEDFIVPESQHPKSSSLQAAISSLVIASLLEVLSTVELDDQFCFKASKVGDVVGHGYLSAESIACKLPVSQASPKVPLGIG
jgi:hypothetical protein